MPSDVQSSIVSKCAIVIDKLAESHSGMTFTEIVASTDFNKSSVHRIISVLLGEELLHHDAARRTYSLGKRSMQWARSAWQKIDFTHRGLALIIGADTLVNERHQPRVNPTSQAASGVQTQRDDEHR